jgi:YidC/Oxa1 family membrane protein insertase
MGGEAGTSELSAMMKPILLYVLPGSMALIIAWQPAALQFTLFVTMLIGAAQALLLRNARFREWAGLHPIIKPRIESQMAGKQRFEYLSRLNMANAYQAPTMRPAFTEQKKSLWGTFKSQVEEAKRDAMKRISEARGEPPERPGDRPKSFLKTAEEYERRRLKEIKADKEFRNLQ